LDSDYWRSVEGQEQWGPRQRLRVPLFWTAAPTNLSILALSAVLAGASIRSYLAIAVPSTVLVVTLLLFVMPRPRWRARHNHWIFVGAAGLSLVAALIIHTMK
jgi:formate-dependent nitrite reductase membrane component NrfD